MNARDGIKRASQISKQRPELPDSVDCPKRDPVCALSQSRWLLILHSIKAMDRDPHCKGCGHPISAQNMRRPEKRAQRAQWSPIFRQAATNRSNSTAAGRRRLQRGRLQLARLCLAFLSNSLKLTSRAGEGGGVSLRRYWSTPSCQFMSRTRIRGSSPGIS